MLEIRGHRENVEIEQTHELDDIPWFQPLSYSLRSFANSEQRSMRFWTIRPDSLEPLLMTVEKDGTELLQTPLGSLASVRLQIRMAGMLKYVWKAHYWFDALNPRFLRYEGVNGPPGTPKTVIEIRDGAGSVISGVRLPVTID